MNHLCKIGLLIFTIFLWGGCLGSSSLTPPSWFATTPKDDSLFVGFGNAKTLDAAKANALSDIITQINVSVQSQFNLNTQRQNSNIEYHSSNDVWLDSSNIEIGSVQYTKNEFKNNLYYVQAQIPKTALIKQFQTKFNNLYNMLNASKIGQCQALSAKEFALLSQNIENLQLYALYLETLNQSTQDLSKFENLLAQNSPLPQAKLLINSNDTSSVIKEMIKNDMIKEYGHFYAIDANAKNTLKNDVIISTNGKEVKIEVTLTILDCKNNPSFSTRVTHTHSASKQYDALRFASQRVSVQLYKQIQEWIER
ncbi:hypothetical protein LS68_004110 [Helicobacter sp. MIT 05-5293]|uniref:LPP20 family lipoprotein n=1 Tax=Helicobacter sp. MIT 05-5293 TaxID=1548149 RepID=UPI000689A601|nr:LPP20 family lipoprotein [Helicobacter sp. MIT 05-5293]TLD82184.1 hypothetical protein LS68_004110 [Helicobacter sp. MIT 05-5293]